MGWCRQQKSLPVLRQHGELLPGQLGNAEPCLCWHAARQPDVVRAPVF